MFVHKKDYECLSAEAIKEINIKCCRYKQNIERNNNLSKKEKAAMVESYKNHLYEWAVLNEMKLQIEMSQEIYAHRKSNKK